MNPKEFADKMKELSERNTGSSDICFNHMDMDDLMCEVLKSLGYNEGVEIFENTHKWYA